MGSGTVDRPDDRTGARRGEGLMPFGVPPEVRQAQRRYST